MRGKYSLAIYAPVWATLGVSSYSIVGISMTNPYPIFSGQDAITLPLDEYFELHPEIQAYLEGFGVERDPVILFDAVREFLASYVNYEQAAEISSTYMYYRSVTERLLLWSWIVNQCPLSKLSTEDLKNFFEFCVSPPPSWVSANPIRRFYIGGDGKIYINGRWRPFSNASKGSTSEPRSLAGIRSACIKLYYYLQGKNLVETNPVMPIDLSFIASISGKGISLVGRLDQVHLRYLLKAAENLCMNDVAHERSLFIIAMIIYLLVPARFLSGSKTWKPMLSNFTKGVEREELSYSVIDSGSAYKLIAPSEFKTYLKRYLNSREILFKSGKLPNSALFTTLSGRPGLTIRQLSNIVKEISVEAAHLMALDGFAQSTIDQMACARLDSIRTASIMHSIDTSGFWATRSRLGYESLNALHNRYAVDSSRVFE